MPFVEKRELYNDYNVVSDELNKLMEELVNGNNQKIVIEKIVCQVEKFISIKKRHDRLVQRFKHHKKSILYYICNYSMFFFPFK